MAKGRRTTAIIGQDRSNSSPQLYKYQILGSSDENEQDTIIRRRERDEYPDDLILDEHLRSFRNAAKNSLIQIVLAAGAIVAVIFWAIAYGTQARAESCDTWDTGFTCSPSISQYWGQYSPYYSVQSEIPNDVPGECKITFAQLLSRHGARDPTYEKSLLYRMTIDKVHRDAISYTESFKFIQDYLYSLGANQLTVFGEQQMVNSGHHFYDRYQDLASHITPFIRSADQNRVVQSGLNWTQGFHQARLSHLKKKHDNFPYPILNISEAAGSNNTLDHGLCNPFELSNSGSEAQRIWLNTFIPPILQRLNNNLPGANLSNVEALFIMDLCPYETVASSTGKLSPFCNLFSEKEWQEYDYYQSVGKYYGYSWGSELAPSQGVGFVNELIARLTHTPVHDNTSTNHTLDSSNITFPLHATLYADFSHDNDMMAIFSALGLYNETEPLTKETMQSVEQMKGYAASRAVPFAGRAYFEKMSCKGEKEEMVRIVVNDRVVPLKSCGGDRLGRCALGKFVDSLSFARSGGNWDKCLISAR
ncbi:histidine phosphatase superfamily [Calycina marina]|uniref:3-phytase n=1 Tax=Calycina marina TaxID=1763456 RepID=A0A9P7ZD28_9HELO|nr:histidine phosphatase superfamily [Calycina marina]